MGRIKIQNTAALGKLADAFHLIPPLITCVQQAGGQRLERMFLAGMKGQRIFPQGLGRQRILQKRFDAAYNQTNSPLGDAVEHLQPGKLIFPANPLHIPEGEFPRRIDQRFFFAGKCIDILTQAGGHGLIRRDYDKRPCLGQRRRYRGLVDMAQARHLGRPSPLCHGRQQHPVLGRR